MTRNSGHQIADTWHELPHEIPVEAVLERLEASHQGLSADEAARRLQTFGPNLLARSAGVPPLVVLARQLKSPLVYVLIAAALITIIIGDPIDTSVILVVVVVNSIIGFAQEYRAEQSLWALALLTAPRARVLRDADEQ